jgi:Na+-transporting methylmalonyl-CoA/oxaloacetate decarboxylase gamma subunit
MEEEMKLANREMNLSMWQGIRIVFAVVFITIFVLSGISYAAAAQQKTFPSAEEAVKAAVAAARSDSDKELLAIFGAQAKDLLLSGDAVADKQRRARFLKAYDEKNSLGTEGDNRIVVVGNNNWPFPIPLVKKGDGWVFDTDKGKEEILNRRIGQNELDAIQVSLAYVDAQREYAMKSRDGGGLRGYAQKFRSDPGKKNGLYWEAKAGEEQSPLGPFAARARSEGYGQNKPSDKPVPYRGYYYKILTAQGKDAPGGARSYILKGKMIGGFALIAYPAEYDNSGIMSFIVNHEGKVFQKDLAKNTASAAAAMKEYNPDKTWAEVKQ